MRTLVLLLTITLAVFLSSCSGSKPLSTRPADNNKDYKIDYLFEYDGCKVYRFKDEGRYVYFTTTPGIVTSYGKDSIRVENRVVRRK